MSNSEQMQKKSNLNGVSPHNDQHSCPPVYYVLSPKSANKCCGIINKGNTCYANVILQCLKIFPVLQSSNDQIKSTFILQLEEQCFSYIQQSLQLIHLFSLGL